AGDVEAVGEERAVAGVRPLVGAHPADGEDDLPGLPREEVAPARPAVDEQAAAVRVAALDLRAVAGGGAGHQSARLLLDPAEGGDVHVRAEQEAGLAGTGLRGEVRLPLDEAVAAALQPPREFGGAADLHRPAQD